MRRNWRRLAGGIVLGIVLGLIAGEAWLEHRLWRHRRRRLVEQIEALGAGKER